MKRNLLLAIAFFSIIGITIPSLKSYPGGAPSDGRTGSPGDGGKTCVTSGCHSGGPTDAFAIISSTIPFDGYTPGVTYDFTVTLDGGANKKGLCVSPQKADGTVMGTLTAGPGNQVSGKGYITHTSPITSDVAVWTFKWVAPAAGSGTVGFYGAFANARSRVRKTLVNYTEKIASGVNENGTLSRLSMYPNPASQSLNIGFEIKKAGTIRITLINIMGKEVSVLKETWLNTGNFDELFSIPALTSGIYFVRMELNNEVLNRKILIQQ